MPTPGLTPVLPMQTAGSWIKLNAGQTGVYRVTYPATMWEGLAAAAAQFNNGQPAISGPDLSGLVDDAFHLAQIGEADIGVFLNLTRCVILPPVSSLGRLCSAAGSPRLGCSCGWR